MPSYALRKKEGAGTTSNRLFNEKGSKTQTPLLGKEGCRGG